MPEEMIQSDPSVMMGKPVIKGTRITVELILEKLGEGKTIEQILDAHPRLTRAGILAAMRFGAAALRADVAYPLLEPAGYFSRFAPHPPRVMEKIYVETL